MFSIDSMRSKHNASSRPEETKCLCQIQLRLLVLQDLAGENEIETPTFLGNRLVLCHFVI